jgi:hypothetical protein
MERFQMNPDTPLRFVILFTGRTGSTYLTEGWFGSDIVRWHGEELARIQDPIEQLREAATYWQSHPGESHRCLGFKIKLADCVNPDGLKALCQDYDAQVICMRRRNYVKQAISFFNSRRMVESDGQSNLYDERQRLAKEAYDPNRVLIRTRDCERHDIELCDYTRDLMRPTLTLFYEDLISHGSREQARVANFLSLPKAPPMGNTLKATSDDLREALPNFEEIRKVLANTKYAPMLEERMTRDAA